MLGQYQQWVQEGTQGKVLNNPGIYNGVTAVPYYRLYDASYGWPHWTKDANEYYTLINYRGWSGEGANEYILPLSPTTTNTLLLYRLVYGGDSRGLHHCDHRPGRVPAAHPALRLGRRGRGGHLIQ